MAGDPGGPSDRGSPASSAATPRPPGSGAAPQARRPSGAVWLDLAVAVGGGLLWAACFRRVEATVLPWIGLAPLCWLLGRPRAPLLAVVHGTVSWVAAIPWIVPTIVVHGGLQRPLAIVLFTLLAAYLGAYHAAFAWLGRSLWRRGAATTLFGLPALWCLLEVARSFLGSGFPWNLAGTAWIAVTGALPLSAWVGVHGISFVALFANAGIAYGVAQRRFWPAAATTLAAFLLLALGARFAAPRSPEQRLVGGSSAGSPARLPARILQPNIPILGGSDRVAIVAGKETMARMTREACDREGALVIWPESAGWPYAFERDAGFRAEVVELASRGCAVLLNSPRFDGDEVYNAAFLVEPSGAVQHYDKRHLVPFGEYVPLATVLPFVGTLARNAGGFSASDRIELLDYGPLELGLAICFEVTFPAEVAALARRGATALVTLTNDAWYGNTAAPWQHLRAARFRAAENHRTVLRAAITGVSAWIGPDGSLGGSMGVGDQGTLRGDLVPNAELTLFTRAPWATPIACALLCLAVYPSAILAERRSRARLDR